MPEASVEVAVTTGSPATEAYGKVKVAFPCALVVTDIEPSSVRPWGRADVASLEGFA